MTPSATRRAVERESFPWPQVTLRELAGLILAFAVSNGLLSWLLSDTRHPVILAAGSAEIISGFWNGMLVFYLAFAFTQSWLRSLLRWRHTGSASLKSRRPARWSALQVAEATVIGGTIAIWPVLWIGRIRRDSLLSEDWHDGAIPLLLIAIVSFFLVHRRIRWNRSRLSHNDGASAKSQTPKASQSLIDESSLHE